LRSIHLLEALLQSGALLPEQGQPVEARLCMNAPCKYANRHNSRAIAEQCSLNVARCGSVLFTERQLPASRIVGRCGDHGAGENTRSFQSVNCPRHWPAHDGVGTAAPPRPPLAKTIRAANVLRAIPSRKQATAVEKTGSIQAHQHGGQVIPQSGWRKQSQTNPAVAVHSERQQPQLHPLHIPAEIASRPAGSNSRRSSAAGPLWTTETSHALCQRSSQPLMPFSSPT